MADLAAVQARAQYALALHQQGDVTQARAIYREVLAHLPDEPALLQLAGMAAIHMQDFADAAALLKRCTDAHPTNTDAWLHYGSALSALGHYGDAVESFGKAVALAPRNIAAAHNRAIALRAVGHHEEALAEYDRALTLAPPSAELLNNRAVTLSDLERHEEAVASCDQALISQPDYPAAHNNRGIALRALRRFDEALDSFTRAIKLNATDAEAFNNRGLTLADRYQYNAAIDDYTRAVALNPNYADAFGNRAICFGHMNQPDAAMADYQKAIALKPSDAHLRINLGHFLADIRRHADALASYRAAWQIKPDTPFLLGYLLYTQLMNCDWENIDAGREILRERMTQDARAASPFPMLSLTDDPALQRKSAEIWARLKYPPQQVPYTQAPVGPKIRVGYFSMDFRQHALATLTAGLYEAHDREKFEIYAFSYGPDTGDAMRKRLEKAFDTFIDVRDRSDAEIATLARTIGIDIAVDLAGYTKQARTGIFALRAAPVQISYLGFPGTMGTPYMDYIIGDDIVIPFEARDHYAEHIIHLPTYQANDHKRERPQITLSRGELGLPEKGFVFCSFNNTYKFSPETFSSWMRILHRVEGAVLFLYADHEVTAENLSCEATACGIDRKRLVFGKQLDMEGYLARYKAAGLFLDTLPYNAGTTAADALWMGLPVLTCTGRAFASRMAASLLNAAGVQELITHTREDYEDRAVELATHPQQLAALRGKLAHVEATLFNTPAFTRGLESAYIQVVARARAGLPPAHVHIK